MSPCKAFSLASASFRSMRISWDAHGRCRQPRTRTERELQQLELISCWSVYESKQSSFRGIRGPRLKVYTPKWLLDALIVRPLFDPACSGKTKEAAAAAAKEAAIAKAPLGRNPLNLFRACSHAGSHLWGFKRCIVYVVYRACD